MAVESGDFSGCAPGNQNFANLTASYTEQLHNASTLWASFMMFALTAIFFNLNLFSRLSDVSAILDPKIRLGLTSALSIFLPVMSYLFSEAKNSGGGGDPNSSGANKTRELPDRARFILIWMLLVELVRKKVEVIRLQGYSGTIERAGRVLWLGSLVFSNLQATGRKIMTGILWMICACKLVQRISFTEFGKRSLAFGKNARLISSYMASTHVLGKDDDDAPSLRTDALLKRCKYAVMDEDKLVVEAIPNGYKFKDDVTDVATVGKIWELADTDPVLSALDRGEHRRLRRLCLSFALFKLLRRRIEHLPAPTAAETRSYRRIIFSGLHDTSASSDVLFDVTSDELDFTCEYYHSVLPVALASPFFLLANYFLVPVVVFVLCLVLLVEASNGDVFYAFRSMKNDNYFTFFGVTQMLKCMRMVFHSPVVFFTTVDFSITFLLFLLFIYEELWEFLVFLLSDWFLVSLICKYATDPLRHTRRRTFGCSVRCILFMRRLMHRPTISFNQLSLLSFCGAVTMPAHMPLKSQILLRSVPVPKQVKDSITRYLTKLYDRDRNVMATLGNGTNALGDPTSSPFADC